VCEKSCAFSALAMLQAAPRMGVKRTATFFESMPLKERFFLT
jgi:hypothetical protein